MSEVYQELCLGPRAENLQVHVDSGWADDKETRQNCSGGAVLFHGCALMTWARTHKTRALFERRGRVVRHRLRSYRRLWSSTTFAIMAVQSSAVALDKLTKCACSVKTQRTRPSETRGTEDAQSAGTAENGPDFVSTTCRLTTIRQTS